MTDHDLLQQAKDQVAKIAGFTNWADLITKSTYLTYTDEKANEAALLAIQSAREEAAPKWWPVEERLPEELIVVLMYTEESMIETGYYHVGRKEWYSGEFRETVTHWMPLPNKPKN